MNKQNVELVNSVAVSAEEKKVAAFRDAIIKEAYKVFYNYYKLAKKQKQPFNAVQFAQIIGVSVAAGGVLGSPVPGIGNACGVAAGIFVGATIATGLELKKKRENKKIKNALKVKGFLGDDLELGKAIIVEVVDQILVNHQEIAQLRDKDQSKVAAYLAANLFKAIKSTDANQSGNLAKKAMILNELKVVDSKKVSSCTLRTEDGTREVTLKSLKY
jgi:hypothetical protein